MGYSRTGHVGSDYDLSPFPSNSDASDVSSWYTTAPPFAQQSYAESSSDANNGFLGRDWQTGSHAEYHHQSPPPHNRSNENHDNLSCSVCGKRFTGKYCRGNLARHERNEHGGKTVGPYPCVAEGCSSNFLRSDALLKHSRRHHPELSLPPVQRRHGTEPVVAIVSDSSTVSDPWSHFNSRIPQDEYYPPYGFSTSPTAPWQPDGPLAYPKWQSLLFHNEGAPGAVAQTTTARPRYEHELTPDISSAAFRPVERLDSGTVSPSGHSDNC